MIENDEQALAAIHRALRKVPMECDDRAWFDAKDAEDYLRRRLAAPASHDAQQPEAAGALAGEGSVQAVVQEMRDWVKSAEVADAGPHAAAWRTVVVQEFIHKIVAALSAAPAPAQQPGVVGDGVRLVREARASIDHAVHGEPGDWLTQAHDKLTKAIAALSAAPAPAQQPGVVGDGGRCPHGVRHPHPCRECEDAALTPAATPVPDGGGRAVCDDCGGRGELHSEKTGWVPCGHCPDHPPEQSRAVAGVVVSDAAIERVLSTVVRALGSRTVEEYIADGGRRFWSPSGWHDNVRHVVRAILTAAADADGGAE